MVTFGGCQDDFMLVVSENGNSDAATTQKLLFNMPKPKVSSPDPRISQVAQRFVNGQALMQGGEYILDVTT